MGEHHEQCPSCGSHDSETVVACHSNHMDDGKGASQKADDCFVAFLCSGCHDWLDGRIASDAAAGFRAHEFHRAMKRTWRILLDDGVLR